MWHMVWLERSSSLCPPSANLQSGWVWMKGICHRRKHSFWQDLNSYSFYKSCWNAVLVHVDDILQGPFLFPYCSYKSVKLRIRHGLGQHISESHSSFSSARTGSVEREKERDIFYWNGDTKNAEVSLGLFAGIHWTKTFICTWRAS